MLLLVAMAAGAETISEVTIGNLVYSLDTDTKVATVTGYDRSNKPTDVVIPNTIKYGGNYSVTTIGKSAFYNCTSLASVNIPNSVTTIGGAAFASCTSLASVSVASDNPNYIGIDGVLFNKDKTMIVVYPAGKDGSEYTIPNSVTTIGEQAFWNCSSLASIDIPNSVTTIGEGAFTSCKSLASVNIGESVTTIGEGAFDDCDAITSVTCLAKECPVYVCDLRVDMFSVYKTATLYVPKQSIDAYKTTAPWSNFVHVVALENAGIEGHPTDNAPRVDAVYDIDGRRTDSMKRGLNIVRMSDGTTRKVMK